MKLNIKNPYLGKGKFLWKHNDDSKLGDNEIDFDKEDLMTDKEKRKLRRLELAERRIRAGAERRGITLPN